ncbi:hypothetical protein BH10CHL1_BH10CHL1_09050 [soil metagenome]
MMFIKRPFVGPADFPAIMALTAQAPVEQCSVTALPYQLSSWAFDTPDNVGLWTDETGRLVGFAVLQVPFGNLHYALQPSGAVDALEANLWAWVALRAQQIAQQSGRSFTFSINVAEPLTATIARLHPLGFTRQDPGRVLLKRDLNEIVDAPQLPAGFQLRHLRGEDEVEAATALLAAAFNITTVTVEWRRRILQRTEYIPELDVVVVAPDRRFAAFCLCWLHPDGAIGQIEPIGTHPEFQRLGLGRAALLEGLRRLQARRATLAYVGTSAGNFRSLGMYRSVGFALHHHKVSYVRTFVP